MGPGKESRGGRYINSVLLCFTGALLVVISGLLIYVLFSQLGNYRMLLANVVQRGSIAESDIALAFARAFDAAVVKTGSIFLAFLLVLLGGLYTFRLSGALYKLSAEGGSVKGAFETASPGLVMLTLGIVVIAVAICKENNISIDRPALIGPQSPTSALSNSAASAPALAGASIKTSLGSPALPAGELTENDARAMNTAIALIDVRQANLTPVEQDAWARARPKIDAARRIIIFDRFPAVREKYSSWATQASQDRNFLKTLSPEQRDQFLSVQQLLGGTYLGQ